MNPATVGCGVQPDAIQDKNKTPEWAFDFCGGVLINDGIRYDNYREYQGICRRKFCIIFVKMSVFGNLIRICPQK